MRAYPARHMATCNSRCSASTWSHNPGRPGSHMLPTLLHSEWQYWQYTKLAHHCLPDVTVILQAGNSMTVIVKATKRPTGYADSVGEGVTGLCWYSKGRNCSSLLWQAYSHTA